jgi:uncharacterized protein (DUF2147 family)
LINPTSTALFAKTVITMASTEQPESSTAAAPAAAAPAAPAADAPEAAAAAPAQEEPAEKKGIVKLIRKLTVKKDGTRRWSRGIFAPKAGPSTAIPEEAKEGEEGEEGAKKDEYVLANALNTRPTTPET